MSASNDSWFVKTEFGAELGPMPRDALTELVRTSALLPGDFVRQKLTDEWMLASEVPGLFASVTPISIDESQEIEDWTSQRTGVPLTPPGLAAPDLAAPDLTAPDLTATTSPAAFPVASDASKLPAEPPTDQADDLISHWKAVRGPTRKQSAMKSLADEVERDLDIKSTPPEIPDIEFEQPVNHLDDGADEPLRLQEPIKRPPATKRPSLMSLVEQREDLRPTQGQGFIADRETWPRKWERWKRSLPSWPIAAGVLVIMVAAWWFWPRSQQHLYSRLLTVWTELKEKRTNVNDKPAWDTFLIRAKTEIDELVPWLEKHSHENREKTLLLYASRDCLRPMLEKPWQTDNKTETRLRLYLDSLQRIYDPSQAPPLPELLGEKPSAATARNPDSSGASPTKNSAGTTANDSNSAANVQP